LSSHLSFLNQAMNDLAAVPALAISGIALVQGLATFFQIYSALIFVRILLTWFPNVDWSNPIFSTIAQLTDPYLNLFRSIIPPLGGIDLSAIVAILALNLGSNLIINAGRQLVALSMNSF